MHPQKESAGTANDEQSMVARRSVQRWSKKTFPVNVGICYKPKGVGGYWGNHKLDSTPVNIIIYPP